MRRLLTLIAALQCMAPPISVAAPAKPRTPAAPALRGSAPAGGPAAELLRVTGQVYYGAAGTEQYRQAAVGDRLRAGDRILTERGRCLIRLADGSTVHLSRKSSFQLAAASTASASGARRVVMRLFSGMMRAIVKPLRGGDAFEVHTPSAIAAVKGTDLAVEVQGGATIARVFDEHDNEPHRVELTNEFRGDPEQVGENMQSRAHGSGDVETPRPMSESEVDRTRGEFNWVEEPAPAPDAQPGPGLIGTTRAEMPVVDGDPAPAGPPGEPAGAGLAGRPADAAVATPEAASHAAPNALDNPAIIDAIPDASEPAESPAALAPAVDAQLDRATESAGDTPHPGGMQDANCACD